MITTGLSTGLAGLHRFSKDFDRAAHQIVRAGLTDLSPVDLEEPGSTIDPPDQVENDVGLPGDSLPDAMVRMLIAQRMFTASLRIVQTADEMLGDAVALADRRPAR